MRVNKFIIYLIVISLITLVITSTKTYECYLSKISDDYNSFSALKKKEYSRICDLLSADNIVSFEIRYGLAAKDYEEFFEIIVNEDFRYFYIDSIRYGRPIDNQFQIEYSPVMTPDARNVYYCKFLETVSIVLSETESLSDCECFTFIYNLVNSYEYRNTSSLDSTAVGCAVNGHANCQGKSKLLRLLCVESDIPCILIKGTLNGEPHMWNCVYIDYKWFYTDTCNSDAVLFDTLPESYCIYTV